jgi:hypothetical protein
MDEKTKSEQPTPEQLLRMLDLQMTAMRERRSAQTPNRGPLRIFAVGIIVVGAALALWVLMYLLEDMRPAKEAPPVPAGETLR